MAVGVQQTWQGLNNQAGQACLDVRNAMAEVLNLSAYMTALGDAGLAALGGDPADVAELQSVVGQLAALAAVWQGTAAQPAAFDYLDLTRPLWGGQ